MTMVSKHGFKTWFQIKNMRFLHQIPPFFFTQPNKIIKYK